MTDFERYKYILDTTGVKYNEYLYASGIDIEISEESIAADIGVNIVFDKNGTFKFFEVR